MVRMDSSHHWPSRLRYILAVSDPLASSVSSAASVNHCEVNSEKQCANRNHEPPLDTFNQSLALRGSYSDLLTQLREALQVDSGGCRHFSIWQAQCPWELPEGETVARCFPDMKGLLG